MLDMHRQKLRVRERLQNCMKQDYFEIGTLVKIHGIHGELVLELKNPDLLENKKLLLIELSEKSETLLDAEKKISINPDYYNGKSAEDLVEMQQDNINNLLKPGKVFPMSLFSFLFIGMLFTIIISLMKYLFRKKLNDF